MVDMTQTIQPRSDQYNADDLIAGPTTIRITKVTLSNNEQQPVNIDYEGGEGKPWKPCKSMRRILVIGWGPDGSKYVGKSLTLYRDPTVKYAGAEQGGIRISHMSDIKDKIRVSLTVTRGKRVPYTVEVLQLTAGNPLPPEHLVQWKQEIEKATTMDDLSIVAARMKEQNYEAKGKLEIMVHYKARSESIRNTETPSEPESLEGEDVAGL